MHPLIKTTTALLVALSAGAALGQPPAAPAPAAQSRPQPVISPEVSADRRVTFRLRAPAAKEVTLGLEGSTARTPLQKDEQGLWSVTVGPLEPDFYGYTFALNGVSLLDPVNPSIKPNLLSSQSIVHVPGPSSLPWEINNVVHGTVHRHPYHSAVVGDDRDYYVYTPPGYDPLGKRLYPVLYLLHGFSDDASGWTAVGRAEVILDNLIARGTAKPMLVVMPLGYGAPEILSRAATGLRDPNLNQRNVERFRDALLTEVIPAVERAYRVARGRESRAIAGLSMGGAESLRVGLNALETFAWVGSFSGGGLGEDYAALFPSLPGAASRQLKLLWMACGTEDRLIDTNRKLNDWLREKNVRHTWVETAGMHTWMVWRRNLAEFATLLF